MATKAHLVIDQGTTFSTDLNLTDQNGDPMVLSNYIATSKIKKWYTSTNSVPFVTGINTNTAVITLGLDANTTLALTPGRYVYDVEIVDAGGVVSRVLEGYVTVTPGVTAVTNPTPNNNIYPNSAPIT